MGSALPFLRAPLALRVSLRQCGTARTGALDWVLPVGLQPRIFVGTWLCRPAGAHVLLYYDPGLPAWANSFRAYGRSRMGVLELRYTKDFASVRPSTSLQVEHLFRALRFCSGQGHPSNLDPRWVYRPEMPEEGLH